MIKIITYQNCVTLALLGAISKFNINSNVSLTYQLIFISSSVTYISFSSWWLNTWTVSFLVLVGSSRRPSCFCFVLCKNLKLYNPRLKLSQMLNIIFKGHEMVQDLSHIDQSKESEWKGSWVNSEQRDLLVDIRPLFSILEVSLHLPELGQVERRDLLRLLDLPLVTLHLVGRMMI